MELKMRWNQITLCKTKWRRHSQQTSV